MSGFPLRTVTVDPGYVTGLAIWDSGTLQPMFHTIKTPMHYSTLERIWCLSRNFKDFLETFEPKLVIMEGVCLWGGSAVSQAGASQGYTFNLSYLVGSYLTRTADLGIATKLIYVTDTVVDNVKYSGWKCQLNSEALRKRIFRVNGVERYPEHVQEAVGMGLSELGLL